MKKTAEAIVDEMMSKYFSPEITDEEAIEFIQEHPDKFWKDNILAGYLICRIILGSPYQALKASVTAYVETLQETK